MMSAKVLLLTNLKKENHMLKSSLICLVMGLSLLLAGCDQRPTNQRSTNQDSTNTQTAPAENTSTDGSANQTTTPSTPPSNSALTQTVSGDGYSYSVPGNWKVDTQPGTNFKTAHDDTAYLHISVVSVPTAGMGFDQVVDAQVMSMGSVKTEKSNFKTDSGLDGVKITRTYDANVTSRQTQYFFHHGDKVFIMTCASAGEKGSDSNEFFDSVAKTFAAQ